MATEEGFYMTLPSNSSMNYFPDNKVNNFVTKLPKHIYLNGSWEVALVEATFPYNFYTLNDEEDNSIIISIKDTELSFTVNITPGYYNTPQELINEMNDLITQTFQDYEHLYTEDISPYNDGSGRIPGNPTAHVNTQPYAMFRYKNSLNRVFVSTYKCIIHLSDNMRYVLGFERNTLADPVKLANDDTSIYKLDNYAGKFPVDLHYRTHSLYVYCDVIEKQIVGDSLAPLLRVLSTRSDLGQWVHKHYNNPHYRPVNNKNFETIRIYISNDIGEMASFDSGRSVVTLHFRRRPL